MTLLTPATVQALLAEHGLRPKKSLGQHFLADPNTARRIVRLAEVDPGDRVVEIGPGLGSLTLALLEAGARVLAVEIDARLAAVLEDELREQPGDARVVVADAAAVPLGELLGDDGPWVCVSNLPYNVAVPVVVRVLETAPTVTRLLVMVQREVGERLAAGPGDEQYGAVSVKVAYHAEADVAGLVPPSVFVPRPKVESVLVRLVRRAAPPVTVDSETVLFELVRAGFAQRRKMLRRSLQPVLGARAEAVLGAAGVAPTARAEALGLDEWAAVAQSASVAA
jgi:16S rRNA (adenine1518-N6/adenine1519-N6)-dimethyltransferase